MTSLVVPQAAAGNAGAGDAAPSRRQARLDDRVAAAQLREQQREADDARRLKLRDERAGRIAARRAARAGALAAAGARLAEHSTDLMFIPVIAVPAWLGWDAMSAFGEALYGGPGQFLPVLSETAMWIFEFAIVRARKKDSGAVVWPLYLGMAVFAAICAALNFAHGLEGPIPGSIKPGARAGVVYALISVSGIAAHQMVAFAARKRKAAAGEPPAAADDVVSDGGNHPGNLVSETGPAAVPETGPAPVPETGPAPVPETGPAVVPGTGPAAVSETGGAARRETRPARTVTASRGQAPVRPARPAPAGESREAVVSEMATRPKRLETTGHREERALELVAEFYRRTGCRMNDRELGLAMGIGKQFISGPGGLRHAISDREKQQEVA